VLVVEQGTILDRVDYNVEESLKDTTQGTKHLVKAAEIQNSMRARGCIGFLTSVIFALALIFVFKQM
jgi:syntaxin 16